MRGLLALALLCAAVEGSARLKIQTEKRPYIKENKMNDDPHGSSQYPYEYLSVCTNGTDDTLLQTTKGRTCPDGTSQVALGRYTNQVNTTGWGILEVETFGPHNYEVQAYAAGVAEGQLTKLQIFYHYKNTIKPLCEGHSRYCQRLYKYLTAHLDWLRSQVLEPKNVEDPYWQHVNLTFAQLTGMYDGYVKRNLTPEIGFDLHPLYMIQLSGELFDLNKYLNKTPDPQEYPEAGRCSGLLKIAPNNEDMFFSHVAMSSYSTMNRILKLYKFAYDPKKVPGHIVSFSGYPAALSSADDYTLTSAGLASIETTIAIFNQTLYTDTYIKPTQVHCWIRSFIANALTKTAKGWVDLFAKYNSGTYNNQWTVVDYKLFTPKQALPKTDLIWILEQTPGYTSVADMTWFVEQFSYWPSYNIPYLTDISIISAFGKKGEQFDWYKWGASPRARIFNRDHHKVVDIETLTKLMRYNDYTNDEFARCKCSPQPYTAEAGISARGDLNNPNGTYEVESMGFRNHGGLDYKGTNLEMFKKLRFRAWGGPPYDPLPVFDWSTTKVKSPHFGQPTVWNFTYVNLEWESEVAVLGFDY